MILTKLYDIAEQNGIGVYSFDTEECESLSLWNIESNRYFIAIDPFKLNSLADERVKLAHELGHCETGSFYNRYAELDVREKHERKADKWAIKKLIPKDELMNAFKNGYTSRYELSELFDVTEDFMQKALDLYFK